MDDQKQLDTPGVGGTTFKLILKDGFYHPLTTHQFNAYMTEFMYGTKHIVNRMEERYFSQVDPD